MQKYRFGDFELDLDAFELLLGGKPVKIERRPLDLLALFVKRPGALVPREEIITALWPPRVIIDFDSGLNTLVRKVRNALGDSSEEPKFIETVPGRGYRFVAPVIVVPERVPEPEPQLPSGPSAPAQSWRRSRTALSSSLLLVAGVALLAWFVVQTEDNRVPAPMRIALMPCENLTGGEELTYLAFGLAEDTNTSLGQIDPDRLRVVGVSTREPIGPELPIDELGRSLGVDYLVMCSLRLDRTKTRLQARLFRVSDGEQIWQAAFDRELTNVLGLQRELAVAIAEQVRLRLSPDVAAAIDRRQTRSPAAYSLYLKGRYEWMRLTPDAIRRAREYFEEAAEEDPDYALAWAGIAFAAITSIRTADAEPAAVKPVALDALRHARRLGPDLAETQYAIGYYSLFGDLDRRAAAESARLAIRLDPNNAQAHMLLGVSLMGDQPGEALEMMRRSRELDPMFALAFANSANVALAADDPEGALEFATQTVAMSEEFWVGHYYLGRARDELGDAEEALRAYADAARFSGGHSLTYSSRLSLLVRLGRIEEARALLVDLEAREAHQYVPPYTLATGYALLGETDAAFEWLNRAVEARDFGLENLPDDRRLQSLHLDPRFEELLARCDCRGADRPR